MTPICGRKYSRKNGGKNLHRTLNKKEVYLYGTLLALVNENFVAMEKHRRGELGMWGRARASSRNSTIDKFVVKLFSYKEGQGCSNPANEILADLSFIDQDYETWGDVPTEQVAFVIKLVAG